ncbi:MAG: adenylate/guanylate cyclase domain-containing protein [Desulfobacterales bacterium]
MSTDRSPIGITDMAPNLPVRKSVAEKTGRKMEGKPKNRVYFTDQMVLIGCGIAAVYWLLDSIVAIFLSTEGPVLHRILGADMRDIWTRLIVLCLFVIFGSHAQYTINERREVAKKLERDRLTRERFQRLLSPDLAEMVVSGQLMVEKGGVSRVATVMFVDIRGFTSMSERTPPDEVLQMLNEYFEIVVAVVFRYEGTVDKFMGDEIMVIWGAPIAHGDDPARAVRAALAIQAELEKFNRNRQAENKPAIKIGVGINTGALVAGYIGSSQTMSYSVIGDTVNTASRLCAAAKAGQIIISENSRNCVEDHFELVEIEAVRAKGKFNPIRAFTVVRELSPRLEITAGREDERSHPSPFPVTAPATKSI